MKKNINRSFTRRVYLDSLFSRKTSNSSNHWVGATFKSFAVIRSKSENFSLNIAPDPYNADIGNIPLRVGYFQNFETIVGDACFENTAVQPGEWVDLLFFAEDRIDSSPAPSRAQASTVELGFARGELDGLTRQVYFEWENLIGCKTMRDIENIEFNTGVVSETVTSVGTFNYTAFFKIPSGFEGRILGAEFSIDEGSPVGDFIEVHAVPDVFSYTDEVTSVYPSIHSLGILSDDLDVIPTGDYNSRPMVNRFGGKGIDRKGLIIDEGEIPLIIFPSGIAEATGKISGFLLIRLSPKVSEL